jgi:manganese/zinc/iron transport system permease protein
MMQSLSSYFTDSVLRAPTIGCMLMCLIASLIGTFALLQRKSLIGEALSHACYPGVILALFIERLIFQDVDTEISLIIFVLAGAFIACLLGIYFINFLEKCFRVPTDAALAVTLSLFFGIGYTILSALQQDYPSLYQELQAYLFGQAATLREIHVQVFEVLAIFVIGMVILFFRPIKAVIFDPVFSEVVGIKKNKIESLLFFLIVLAVVIGIRSIGVVLMSAMLIFPAASSSQFTKTLASQLILASLFGILSGFFGVVFSHEISHLFLTSSGKTASFPTGPMIVMIAAIIFLFSILFAPKKGLLSRVWRRVAFFMKCDQENILKSAWKICVAKEQSTISYTEIEELKLLTGCRLKIVLFQLLRKGLIRKEGKAVDGSQRYVLTTWGMLWGRKIVRLHRLWEVYLVEYCKVAKDRVHPSAEVMEHIITPEIEQELTLILHNPQKDPHAKPIPPQDELLLLQMEKKV